MREDMFEVIIERPRRGGGYSKKGRADEKLRRALDDAIWFGDDADAPRTKSPMLDRSYSRKSLNENLSPLKRFLDSAIGRPWDEVYSEIRSCLSPKSAVQMHVIDHLKQFVVTSTAVENGIIGYYGGYWPRGFIPLEDDGTKNKHFRSEQFYVHPDTKLLCVSRRKKYRWDRKPANEWIYIDNTSQFRKVDDVWYMITLGDLKDWWRVRDLERYILYPYQARGNDLPYEAINFGRDSWGIDKKLTEWERKREFGQEYLYSIEKRQCGKRELKLVKKALANGGKLPR